MLLYEVVDQFTRHRLPYAVVGGFGLALHGLVRATVDLDLVLNLSQSSFEKAEKILISIGLSARLPVRAHEVFKMRREYIERRNLIAWSFVDHGDPSRVVDIIITENRQTLEVEGVRVAGRKIWVASLEELYRMKMTAGRPQDLVDATNIRAKINGKV